MYYYGRLLIHVLNYINLNNLGGNHAFPMTNVLACLLVLGEGNVFDYILVEECDAFIVNTFSIGQLSTNSDHNASYLHTANKNSHIY